jgi:hypothetical protein
VVPLQIALTRGHLVSDLAAIRHVLLDNLANYDKHTPAFDAVRAELVTATPGRDPTGDDLPRLPRLKAVIQETLRPYPPIWMFDRRALGPDDLAGTPVAKGDLVIFCPYALHRLPQLWSDPDAFRPERFEAGNEEQKNTFAYLPFSAGPSSSAWNELRSPRGNPLAQVPQNVR